MYTWKDNNKSIIPERTVKCSHDTSISAVNTVILHNIIKTRAIKYPFASPGQIIQNISRTRTIIRHPTDHAMKEMVRRQRPPMFKEPRSVDEIIIPDVFKTSCNQKFIYEIPLGSLKIIIFTTISNLRRLAESTFWIADGTFSVVPKLFRQLYTIHGNYGSSENIYPFVYALLPNKLSKTYDALYNFIINLAQQHSIHLKPPVLITDFEKGAIKSFKKFFPNSSNHCCYFHLAKRLEDHFRSKKCANKYHGYIKLIKATSFLPAEDIRYFFNELTFPSEISSFMNYFIKNFVGKEVNKKFRDPLFPPSLWSNYLAIKNNFKTTSNHVEGWHHRVSVILHRSFKSRFFDFVDFVKKENEIVDVKCVQICRLKEPIQSKTCKKYSDLKFKLEPLVNSYDIELVLDYLNDIHEVLFGHTIPFNL